MSRPYNINSMRCSCKSTNW